MASRIYASPTTTADFSGGAFANIPAGPSISILHPLATLQNPTHQKASLGLYSAWALLFLLLLVVHCITTPSRRTRALGRNFSLAYPLALLAAALTSTLYLADTVLTYLTITRPRAYILLYTARYFSTLSTLTLLLACVATAISQLHRRQSVSVVARVAVGVLAGLVLATTGLLLQAAIAWIQQDGDENQYVRITAHLAVVSEFWAFGVAVVLGVLSVGGRGESRQLGARVRVLVVPAALAVTIYRVVLTGYYTIPALDGEGKALSRVWPLIHAAVSPFLFLLLAVALLLLGRVERGFLHGGVEGKGRPETLRSEGEAGGWLPPIERTEELRYSWASTQPARTVLSMSDTRTVESEAATTVMSGPPPVMRRGPARRVDQVGP